VNALAWLNDLVQWFGRWVPRLTLIEPTHRGVLFGPRGGARAVGPGLVLYWPISHALVLVPVTTQSLQLCSQVLPGGGVERWMPCVTVCAAAIQIRVNDPVLAATRALNLHALIDNRASAAIARWRMEDRGVWAERVRDDMKKELAEYGVVLERFDFTQFGEGVALKNISDWSYDDNQSGTRPS
jgi:regulator of protease activity HflC (stomatin/prohibitin superfamily)